MTSFDPTARIISNLGWGGFAVTSSDRSAGDLKSVTQFSERKQKTSGCDNESGRHEKPRPDDFGPNGPTHLVIRARGRLNVPWHNEFPQRSTTTDYMGTFVSWTRASHRFRLAAARPLLPAINEPLGSSARAEAQRPHMA
jgi:hypothetical protein